NQRSDPALRTNLYYEDKTRIHSADRLQPWFCRFHPNHQLWGCPLSSQTGTSDLVPPRSLCYEDKTWIHPADKLQSWLCRLHPSPQLWGCPLSSQTGQSDLVPQKSLSYAERRWIHSAGRHRWLWLLWKIRALARHYSAGIAEQ